MGPPCGGGGVGGSSGYAIQWFGCKLQWNAMCLNGVGANNKNTSGAQVIWVQIARTPNASNYFGANGKNT